MELVSERQSRQPLSPPGRAGSFVSDYCRRKGMILRANGDILVLAPALIMTDEQADEMVALLNETLGEAVKQCKSKEGNLVWNASS